VVCMPAHSLENATYGPQPQTRKCGMGMHPLAMSFFDTLRLARVMCTVYYSSLDVRSL